MLRFVCTLGLFLQSTEYPWEMPEESCRDCESPSVRINHITCLVNYRRNFHGRALRTRSTAWVGKTALAQGSLVGIYNWQYQ
jgi:hypothetical protein